MSMHRIAFALILLAAPASAERLLDGPVTIDAPLSEQYTACFDKAAGNDLDMATCDDEETSRWDRRLNAVYVTMRRQLEPADFTDLQKAQRAWITFRDLDCKANGNMVARGGTASRLMQSGCLLRHTVLRAAELERFVRR